jgi:hypothetical protein
MKRRLESGDAIGCDELGGLVHVARLTGARANLILK